MAQVITKFLLPPTFPPEFVPHEAGMFQIKAMGKTLESQKRRAQRLGFMPIVSPLKQLGEGYFHFALTVDGMLVPFAVEVGEKIYDASKARQTKLFLEESTKIH